MRNLKLLNHWIAELREIASKSERCFNEGESEPMLMPQIRIVFNVCDFEDRFHEGLTPQEAFDNELEMWLDAE